MGKKKLTKQKSSRSLKSSSQFTKNIIFRYIVVISVLVITLIGLFAITKTQSWYYFASGKEQFVPDDQSIKVGYFHGQKISVPSSHLAYNQDLENTTVLGDSNNSNKRIEVDLTYQRVYAYDGNQKTHEFVVSTGLWGRTPTGEFTIERRVPIQAMTGGNKALGTYYYLPGVRYVQFFGNSQIPWWRGFSFHSTYWHNNFGHPMSHGCINMTLADSETLWNWAGDVGTKVIIYGTAPA